MSFEIWEWWRGYLGIVEGVFENGGGGIREWWKGYLGMVEGVFKSIWWRGYLGMLEEVFGDGGRGIWNLPRIWSFCHTIWLKYYCYFRL